MKVQRYIPGLPHRQRHSWERGILKGGHSKLRKTHNLCLQMMTSVCLPSSMAPLYWWSTDQGVQKVWTEGTLEKETRVCGSSRDKHTRQWAVEGRWQSGPEWQAKRGQMRPQAEQSPASAGGGRRAWKAKRKSPPLQSPLTNKIKQGNPKGNQSWIFIGRTDAKAGAPILWPPDAKG